MAVWNLVAVFIVGLILQQSTPSYAQCGGGSVRLVGGTMGREGRLEVCYSNEWGTVCSDYFGNVDARVACRHVGYPSDGAIRFPNAYFGQGTGKIWLDDVQCTGNEGSIFSCPRNPTLGTNNCGHNRDVGIRCPPCVEGNVVFIRGSSKQGVPMICHDGSYGTICDTGFDVNDAKVICKQLGYPTEGVQAFNGSTQFQIGYGPIWATNLGCTGNEDRISDCTGQFFTDNACTHNQDAGVICPGCGSLLDVQLWSPYPETPQGEGMLQICQSNGQWAGVCRKGSWCQDGKVACRDLGFNGSNHIVVTHDVDQIYGYIRNINPHRYNCIGNEYHMIDCPRQYDSTCDNPQYETVGLRCTDVVGDYDCTNGDVRFRKGLELSDTVEGRVEYCFENHWSPFCWMADEEASVICKQKGFTQYTWAAIYDDERYGSAGLISDLKSIQCSTDASENSISECQKVLNGACTVTECNAEYGMQCFNPGMCDEGTYRLVDGDIEQEGRIEVCVNGVWGSFCDYGWNAIDAYVFCRSMGYDGTIAPTAYTTSEFGDGIYPIVWTSFYCKGWESDIKDCYHKSYFQFYCPRYRVAGVLCAEDCEDGDVRLVGGKNESEGTVEVCFGGLWGLIDAEGFDDTDAQTICRQLSLRQEGSFAVLDSSFGRPNKTVHLTNVMCAGTEGNLNECSKTVISLNEGKTLYKNNQVAGVDCIPEPPTQPACVVMSVPKTGTDCVEGTVRVIDGNTNDNSMDGRLEYCTSGKVWSAFCTLSEEAASTVCRHLGFIAYDRATIISSGVFGSPNSYSLIDNVTCSGGSNFSACDFSLAGDCIPYCPNSNIGIRCFNDDQCNHGDIRLAGGYIEQEGRVEICFESVWGVICDQGWDKTDAHIACQQLGHPELEPIVYTDSYFGDGDYPIIFSNFQCVGPEADLYNCAKDQYSDFSCPRTQIAGMLCGYDCKNGDVRLVGGSTPIEGTVEVCFDNLWGLIGDGGWSDKDASLICKLLGHSPDFAKPILGSEFGKPNKTLLLSEVACTGDEVQLDQCAFNFHSLAEGKALIDLVQVAGVSCLPNGCVPSSTSGTQCTNGALKVMDGVTIQEGNLFYCINGTWSPFCGLELDEASVACRQLGFPNNDYASIFEDNRFNPTTNMSYFENFNCSDNSTTFADCGLNDYCISQCTNISAIRCYAPTGCTEGEARLVNGYLQQEGRLEVCLNGVWSTICDTNFDQSDALVACATLGYNVAEPVVYRDSMFGEGSGPIVYTNMGCEGYERDLRSCDKDVYPYSTCARTKQVGVLCKDGCADGDVKLVSGTENEGLVLMCLDDLWSMIDQNSWDTQDAQVACRSLGYPTLGAAVRPGNNFVKPNKTLSFYNTACIGNENTLFDCADMRYTYDQGKLYALNTTAAAVYCMPPDPTEPPTICPITPTLSSTAECVTGDVALLGGPTSAEGRLMYCYSNAWSPFCSVDSKTASVACKNFGYTGTTAAVFTDGRFGNSPLNYSLFVSMSCEGSEGQLSDCPLVSTGCVPTCNNNIAIRCYNPVNCDNGDIRLSDGSIQQQGRVEICTDQIWSTICATNWDNSNAFVVCKQLGFAASASAAFADNLFGSGTGPIVYSDVQCVAHEDDISACPKKVYPESSCPTGIAAGVMCSDGCKDGDLMLYGGNDETEGTVEVCFDNIWGLISQTGWTISDAIVVCNQLGLDTNEPMVVTDSESVFGKPAKTVHLTNVNCKGAEMSITDCAAFKNGLNDAEGISIAGVRCPPIPVVSSSVTKSPTPTAVSQESSGVSVNSLYMFSGILGVCAVLAILSVIGLFVFMMLVYQKRSRSTDMQSQEKRINRKSEAFEGGAMPLYAVVNRNRDSMVSYSANDDEIKVDY